MTSCINAAYCEHRIECDPEACEDFVPALEGNNE